MKKKLTAKVAVFISVTLLTLFSIVSCAGHKVTPEEKKALSDYRRHISIIYGARSEMKGETTLILYVEQLYESNYDNLASYILEEARSEGCTQILKVEIHDPLTKKETGSARY